MLMGEKESGRDMSEVVKGGTARWRSQTGDKLEGKLSVCKLER
ncbi:hypothetical protein RCO48_19145 [Peribacillus frigoritolerans]|nr:hypothetical protein [Peribacillus frigoritolerans]